MPASPLASVAATRAVLEAHELTTKKALGQHFLVNDAIVEKICATAEVAKGDKVVEVGPGIGTLTCALLAQGADVVAVERDKNLPAVLEQTCGPWAEHFTLLGKDALQLQEGDLPFAPRKFIANLPYAVAASLVLDYFERFDSLQQATVMVQAEVADRMAARPGTKDYGAYTVKLALYAQPSARFKVGPSNFFPPPRVDSAVIRLDRTDTGLAPEQRRAASCLADAAFANRRKTIANSAKTYFAQNAQAQDALPALLEACGIEPTRRGETLGVEEFLHLGQVASVQFNGIFCPLG